ncbi:MAG: hypothetical protein ABR549_07320 [Mycobacteriales bacterium]
MTPFLQFRMWARRAPGAERLLVAGLLAALVGLLGWALVPVGAAGGTPVSSVGEGSGGPTGEAAPSGSSSSVRPGMPSTKAGTTGTATGARPGGTPKGVGAGSVPLGPSVTSNRPQVTGPGPCAPSGSTDQGATGSEVHIDVVVADLAGQAGNSLVGIPSAAEQQEIYTAAIDGVNKEGGIRCRKLVPKFYKANPLDQSSLEAICLDIVSDKPFAVLDTGLSSPVGSPAPRDCPAAHKIPTFDSASLGQAEVDKFAPYLFSYYPAAEKTVHDAILASQALGFFKGAAVVGVLMQQCNPHLNTISLRDLAALGFTGKKLKTFDFGCPNGIPAPQDVQSAVLQFRNAGVTHVFDDAGVYESYFSRQAAAQGYKPRYSVGDQGTIALWNNPNFGPDPRNFDGGLAITGTRYGEEGTPGSKKTAQSLRCDRAMRAKGLPTTWDSPDGFSGVACAERYMLVHAGNSGPTLRRDQLAAGLAALGTVDLPYPAGPAAFGSQRGQIGGGFWRAATFHQACKCFQVSRTQFTPDFR